MPWNNKKKMYDRLWAVILIIAIGVRVWMGELTGAWFLPYSPNDDVLMVNYACKFNPFMIGNVSPGDMPVKELMYPFYLLLVEMSGLSYTMVLSFTWIAASFMVMRMFRYLTDDRAYGLFVFVTVLFTPIAFEYSTGTRLYRNAIIPPFVLMVFTLALIILFRLICTEEMRLRAFILHFILLGVLLMFTAHIKEDGIWLLVSVSFASIVYSVIIIIRWRKKYTKKNISIMLLAVWIPLLVCAGLTNVCRLMNYQLFGVYETNIRTEGELADFINQVYKVKSDNRSSAVWVPTDAIEKVFEESETLRQYPRLLDSILHTTWFSGDIYENPIRGDFFCWVLRDALFTSGLWESERQVSDLFAQVNAELEEAFEEGRLIEEDKVQLLSSVGGRSMEEILALKDDVITGYECVILLKSYIPGAAQNTKGDADMISTASALTNMDFSSGLSELRDVEIRAANSVIRIIFVIYTAVQIGLCFLTAAGIIWSVAVWIRNIRKREKGIIFGKEMIVVSVIFVLTGISLAYLFSVAWFLSYLFSNADPAEVLKFYGVGAIPLMSLVELLGCYLFVKQMSVCKVLPLGLHMKSGLIQYK